MTKQQFTEVMKELVSLKEAEEALRCAFSKFDPNFCFISFSRYENLVTKSIKIAMNDKNDWIEYWIYECDCGKNTKLKVTCNGKKVKFRTIEDLYNLIKKL